MLLGTASKSGAERDPTQIAISMQDALRNPHLGVVVRASLVICDQKWFMQCSQ